MLMLYGVYVAVHLGDGDFDYRLIEDGYSAEWLAQDAADFLKNTKPLRDNQFYIVRSYYTSDGV